LVNRLDVEYLLILIRRRNRPAFWYRGRVDNYCCRLESVENGTRPSTARCGGGVFGGLYYHQHQQVYTTSRVKHSPFFFELSDDVFGGEVHVDFGCLDSVVAEQFLKGPEADATFQTAHSKGVAQDVGADWLRYACAVGQSLDDALNLAGADTKGVLHGVVVLDETSDAGGHRKNPNLRPLAKRASFAPDSQAFLLPLNITFGQIRQLGDPDTGVEQGEDDQLFTGGVADLDEPVDVGVVQGFTLVLDAGHVAFSVARRHDVAKGITRGPGNKGVGETSAGRMSPLLVEGDILTLALTIGVGSPSRGS